MIFNDVRLPRPGGAAKIAAVEVSVLLSTGSALLAGLLFGYCAQRGGFCLTRALSNWVLMGDTAILRAYVLALLSRSWASTCSSSGWSNPSPSGRSAGSPTSLAASSSAWA